ncbi:MAG: hypothetical protein ABSE91_01055 [Patescibacteria group bacterium]
MTYDDIFNAARIEQHISAKGEETIVEPESVAQELGIEPEKARKALDIHVGLKSMRRKGKAYAFPRQLPRQDPHHEAARNMLPHLHP